MNIKKMVIGLLAALALTWAPAVYAADNGTEFGIEDDLTVLGTAGSGADPDAEIKGFTVFGSTQVTYPGPVQSGTGNVVVNGYLAVSSGMYVSGSSTFTTSVNLPAVNTIYVPGGAVDQVLTQSAVGGPLKWSTVSSMVSGDNLGSHVATKTLDMSDFGIINVASVTVNDWITAGTYIMATTSMTVGTNLGVGNNLVVGGNQSVTGTSTYGSSVTVNGNLGVSGANELTVGGTSTFGSSVTVSGGFGATGPSTFTASVNLPSVDNIRVPGGAVDQVLTQSAVGGPLKWSTVSSLVAGDNLGNHTATETLKMSNFGIVNVASITANGYIMTNTSMTVTTNLGVGGVAQLGDLPGTDYVGINGAGDATTALKVVGEDVSAKYSAKFYSGANLAAWIKKK